MEFQRVLCTPTPPPHPVTILPPNIMYSAPFDNLFWHESVLRLIKIHVHNPHQLFPWTTKEYATDCKHTHVWVTSVSDEEWVGKLSDLTYLLLKPQTRACLQFRVTHLLWRLYSITIFCTCTFRTFLISIQSRWYFYLLLSHL